MACGHPSSCGDFSSESGVRFVCRGDKRSTWPACVQDVTARPSVACRLDSGAGRSRENRFAGLLCLRTHSGRGSPGQSVGIGCATCISRAAVAPRVSGVAAGARREVLMM